MTNTYLLLLQPPPLPPRLTASYNSPPCSAAVPGDFSLQSRHPMLGDSESARDFHRNIIMLCRLKVWGFRPVWQSPVPFLLRSGLLVRRGGREGGGLSLSHLRPPPKSGEPTNIPRCRWKSEAQPQGRRRRHVRQRRR